MHLKTQPVRMTNRLRIFLRALPFCAGLFFCLLPTARLSAQPDFFNFNYNGPDTLSVDINCNAMLQGNIPNPVVTSTMGFTIITSMFDAVAAGFQYNDLFTSGTVAHVYWYVEDNMGHSHTYEYFIQIVDNMPPTFDLTGVFDTLEFSSVVQVPAQTSLPILDNCTGVVSDTFYQTALPDTCQTGIVKRTWIATDENSNTAVFTQTIIIYADTLSPLITGYPQNGSAPCEQLATAYPVWLANQVAIFNATDASGIASLTNNAPPTFPPGCKEPLPVRFKAVDNCQFQLNVDVTFTTSDTQGPIVVKPPKDTVAYCSQNDNELAKLQEWISTRAYSQAFDTCSAPLTYSMKIGTVVRDSAQVVAAFLASFANGCSTQTIGNQEYNKVHGFVSVNFFAKDDCGNETLLGNADFGAIDTLRPVVSGVNITEQCGGGNDQSALQSWINAHGNATVVEDCSGYSWTNFTFTTSSGQSGAGNFNVGPYPSVQANNCTWFTDVTFRVTDDCGNSNTVTLRWSIVDTQAPTFTGLQPNVTVYCPNPLPTVPAAIVADNCDANVAISFSRIYQDSLCDGSYTVVTTWTALDDCGNSASAVQNIFVSDTTRPVFTLLPPDQTFRCDTFVLPPAPVMGVNIMATDVCSPVVSITTSTNSLQNPDPDSCGHYTYDIIRTFTAMDECGNTQTATQTISVIDNLGPVGGGVLDTTALCSALVPFPAPTPIATDACSGLTAPPTNNGQTITPGLCTDQYTITVHWVAEDVCGNKTSFDQLVHVIDTVPPTLMNIPPNITVECDAIPAPPETALFNAADNCDLAVSVNLVQTEIRSSDTASCEYWTDYIVQREWTATDNCGNSRTYTQQIQIEDTTPPAIVPPMAMMFPNDPGDCGAEVMIPAPLSVTDVCTEQFSNVVIADTKPLVASGPGSPFSVPVASMSFQLVAPNFSPFEPVVNDPNMKLRVFLDNADAEGAQEFLLLYDENNILIDTLRTTSQCGDRTRNFIVTTNQLNGWLADGIANFSVVPNGTGPGACNPVCPGGQVSVTLEYRYANSNVPIQLTYTVDGGPSQNYPPPGPTFLGTGTHTVVYTATDCVGNSSTASVQITVNDTQAPSMVAPSNITVYTGQNNCEGTVMLPFPVITENCEMSASLSLASAVLPLHFENDANVGWVASDISVALTGIVPNAVGTGILKIRHKGDNADLGEFFNVFDETGAPLDSTTQGTVPGECSTFHETSIPVSAAQINAWAELGGAFGSTTFYLESNRDLINFSEFIENCAPLLPNGTDGISQVQVVLEYSYAVVDYSIKNALNQVVSSGTLTGNITKDTLPPGNYTVMYTTTDNAGLSGMASFSVAVRDTVKPKAICQPTFIVQVDPSGASPYILTPSNINNGSNDNCTAIPNLTYSVTPNSISCNLAGSTVISTLTVTDSSGNSASCQTSVGVTTTPPNPVYTPVCENYELQLFALPPSMAPYSYQWSGPNNYFSNQPNPIVTSNAMAIHNGTYCVTITGATGCTSFGCIQVNLAILGVTPTLASNGVSFCPGQTVLLSTPTYQGQNVSYQWFQDASPNQPILLGETTVNNFGVPNLAPGVYTFYVKVFANGCNTALSNSITITMHPTPPADAEPEMTLVCEGQPISLQSPTPPTGGLTYTWTGPNSYSSTAQNPLVAASAVESQHEGKYILVTQRNGCFSNPDTVMVNINPKPAKPSLSGVVNVCEGQTIILVCNTMSADQWIWTSPQFDTFFTGPSNSANVLQIPNADQMDEGQWTVIVSANNCFSDESNPITVKVQAYPVIMAGSNAPICQDSLLKLTATYTSPDSITIWNWTGPGFASLVQNPIQPNGASGVYQVIANTSFGCADTATVNVTNVVAPLISFIGNNAPACCNGTAATLSATVNSGNHPLTYQWTGPGNPPFSSTLPSPVIGDVCVDDNGQYTLIVKDSFGCPSLPATTAISIQAPPPAPTLSVNPPQPVCAGTNVLLTLNPPTAGASYLWNRPGSLPDTTTQTAFLSISNAQTWHTGGYTVTVISANGTCQSSPSNTVTLTVFAIPATPTVDSNSPVCQGGVLELYGPTVSGASYFWTGPFGFVSSQEDPTRMPVTLGMAGQYRLRIEINNCSSGTDSTLVEVVPTPIAPVIAPPSGPICIDGPVTDFLNVVNPQNGMVYTWENAANGILLQSSTSTGLFLGLPNVLALGPGSHTFRVVSSTPSPAICSSAVSNIVTVVFDTIPAGINAFAGLDHYACVDSAILLFGTPNPLTGALKGLWTQVSGPDTTIYGATTPNASFFGVADSIYTFRWSLSNGACSNFSSDEITITAQNPEIANAGPDIYSCEILGIQLHATQGTTTQGKWTQLGSQSGLGVVIDNPLNPNTTISGLPGRGQSFAFTWEIENEGCGKSVDKVEVYVYNIKPNAGANQFICSNEDCAQLQASTINPSFETGVWSSNDPSLIFTINSPNSAQVCNLKPGVNVIYWEINNGACGDLSRDTLEVFYEIFPTAFNDVVGVTFGTAATVNALANDVLPNTFTAVITIPPVSGTIVDEPATGTYVYRPGSGFTGTDVMTYRICNTQCPDACSFATVTFNVGGLPDCVIPTIITPNGDGFNDLFTIPSLCTVGEGAANLEVTIFNQWGDLVFHEKPYLNNWGGTYNNEDLPAGTYFFVVKLNETDKPLTGFLLIQR